MLRKEIDHLPELPISLLERRLRSVTLDGDGSDATGVMSNWISAGPGWRTSR